MQIIDLAIACEVAVKDQRRISLTYPKGKRHWKGFPRGELLCENPNTGERTYSFDPMKILMSMHRAGLVQIRLTRGKRP